MKNKQYIINQLRELQEDLRESLDDYHVYDLTIEGIKTDIEKLF